MPARMCTVDYPQAGSSCTVLPMTSMLRSDMKFPLKYVYSEEQFVCHILAIKSITSAWYTLIE